MLQIVSESERERERERENQGGPVKYATVSKVFHAYRQRGKDSEKGIRSEIYKPTKRERRRSRYKQI
jgi:hypothetical protein